MIHYQSGCKWEDNELKGIQLQHDREDRWTLLGYKQDGSVESARVSKKVARILLANGVTFGN